MPGDGHGKRRSLLHDGAYKRLHGASLLRCIVTCPERQRCNRHAGLVPASNFPRALMSEARWTPEQVRGDGAAKFWGKPRCPVHYSAASSVSAARRSTETSRLTPCPIKIGRAGKAWVRTSRLGGWRKY